MHRIIFTLAIAATSFAQPVRPPSQPLSVASQQARKAPDYLEGGAIYQIWLRSFTPEGTIKAAAARLPHIAQLGAAVVQLSPITLQSKLGGFSNPYRIQDYFAVDPEYGTEADLKAFIDDAHKLGLKVIMDVVYYHTSPDSEMMKQPEKYMLMKDGKVVLGNWRLPRPDFSKPATREYLTRNLLYWVQKTGIDGYRCDVAAGLPLDFWEAARLELDKINPEIFLLAESEMPAEQLKAFDVSYNFTYIADVLMPVLRDGEPVYKIRENWERQKAIWPRGSRLIYTLDNHDLARPVTQFGEAASFAATTLNFALDGVPFFYNGQELGDTTVTDHQAHRPMPWELGKPQPSGPAASRFARAQAESFAKYKKLFEMRKAEAALHSGDLVWIDNSRPESVVSFMRRTGDEQILVVINLSNRRTPVIVDLPMADFMPATDLLTGKRIGTSIAAGQIAFHTMQGQRDLKPFEALVLKRVPPQLAEPAVKK
jgi:glycosidase